MGLSGDSQRALLTDDPRGFGRKPLWPPADAADAAWELARGGAAVTQGEVLDVSSGAPERLAREPWMETGEEWPELHPAWRRWSCARRTGEEWQAFADRSAAQAAAMVRRLAGRGGRGGMAVDLAWVTPDELALWDLPRDVRLARERLAAEGGAAGELWEVGTSRVTNAQPEPGTYHSAFPAPSVASVPADARFAHLARGTEGLTELRARTSLRTVRLHGAQDKHLAALPPGDAIRDLHVTGTVTSLAPVAGLTALRILSFSSERRLKDEAPLAPLAGLDALRYLELRPSGMRDLSSLPPLAELTSLHFRSAADRIESLAPLGALTGLRWLTVMGPAVRDPSLRELRTLTRLRYLGLWTGAFPLAEYARLAVTLPRAEGTLRGPLQRPEPEGFAVPRCEACSGEMVHTLGRPRRTFCAACEPARAAAYQAEWEVLRSAGTWPR